MKPDDEQSTTGREGERILLHLRHAIRDQGFTQLQVQEALGWGRSYIKPAPYPAEVCAGRPSAVDLGRHRRRPGGGGVTPQPSVSLARFVAPENRRRLAR